MAEIIPAILPKSYEYLKERLTRLGVVVFSPTTVQIDIADGKFVPNTTWPKITEADNHFAALLAEKEGLPEWGKFDFEFDLMVAEPARAIADWIHVGASRVVVHLEALSGHGQFNEIRKLYAGAVELGLAVGLDAPFPALAPFLAAADFVQVMGIAKIGFQGQPFDERAIVLVENLRRGYPDLKISVDGGVNLETAPALLRAGASRLVVGSALWESDDLSGIINTFREL